MYLEFYGLSTDPFRQSPDAQPCFSHASYARAEAYLKYALHKREGIVLLTGAPGLGKTSLVAEMVRELSGTRARVRNLSCGQWTTDDLYRYIGSALGLETANQSSAALYEKIELGLANLRVRKNRHSVLILDEAQALPPATLEELRLLSNMNWKSTPLLQIALVGQPGLRETILSPEFEQLHQRIVANTTLRPLSEAETGDYIEHRLNHAGRKSAPELADSLYITIHRYSTGVPRWINLICSRLLLHGMVESRQKLGADDLRQVLDDLMEEELLPLAVRSRGPDVRPQRLIV